MKVVKLPGLLQPVAHSLLEYHTPGKTRLSSLFLANLTLWNTLSKKDQNQRTKMIFRKWAVFSTQLKLEKVLSYFSFDLQLIYRSSRSGFLPKPLIIEESRTLILYHSFSHWEVLGRVWQTYDEGGFEFYYFRLSFVYLSMIQRGPLLW